MDKKLKKPYIEFIYNLVLCHIITMGTNIPKVRHRLFTRIMNTRFLPSRLVMISQSFSSVRQIKYTIIIVIFDIILFTYIKIKF